MPFPFSFPNLYLSDFFSRKILGYLPKILRHKTINPLPRTQTSTLTHNTPTHLQHLPHPFLTTSTKLRCRQFRGDSFQKCQKYEIPRVLDAFIENGRQKWNFIKNRYSIMSNEGKSIDDIWIDRDTYQKALKILSKKAVVPNDEELYGESIVLYQKQESSLKAIITGFYDERERKFLTPDLKIRKTKLFTPSVYPKTENTKLPVITFQLKEGERVLETIKQLVLKMQIKTLYKNKTSKIEPLGLSPLMAAFKIPLDYKTRSLRIVILDPWKKEISSISLKKRTKPVEVSMNFIEKKTKR